jgi:two-component system chemotaxis sensor kinase CheA
MSVSQICHEWEREISEKGYSNTFRFQPLVTRAWNDSLEGIKGFIQQNKEKNIEIDESEFAKLLTSIQSNKLDQLQLFQMIQSWKFEPLSKRLARLAEQAGQVASKLEKKVRFIVEGNSLRIDTSAQTAFWSSLVHVIRNAVDHGVETPDDRLKNAKDECATISLRASTVNDGATLCLEVSDDGKGIAWNKVKEMAQKLGLPCSTEKDLENAIFFDSVSTKENVTEFSGSGVGLSAVKSEVESAKGSIQIDSQEGKGTLFRFLLPIPQQNISKKAA